MGALCRKGAEVTRDQAANVNPVPPVVEVHPVGGKVVPSKLSDNNVWPFAIHPTHTSKASKSDFLIEVVLDKKSEL